MVTKEARSMKNLREQKRSQGLCSWSGCYEEVSEGFRRCTLHREKEKYNSRNRERKYYQKDAVRLAEMKKKRKEERSSKGICISCGHNAPVGQGKRRCRPCMDKQNANSLVLKHSKGTNVCPNCPELKVPGRSRCAYHLADARMRVALRKGIMSSHKGVVGKDFYQKLMEQQGGKCAFCSTKLESVEVHIDHMVPLSRGGMHDESNLQLLCARCNEVKGPRTQTEFALSKGRLF